MIRIITYGTFDTLHYGHIHLLERAKSLGDYLIVGLSSDKFNIQKGKKSIFSYEERKHTLEAIRYVDFILPEESWDQKAVDIEHYRINKFVMGSDWSGKFDSLKSICSVHYLPRTKKISSSLIKQHII